MKSTNNEMEHTSCNLCGADDTEVVFEIPLIDHYQGRYETQNWFIVRCKQCNLIYVNPRLTQEKLKEFYEFNNQTDIKFVEDWFIESADLQRPTWHRYLNILQKHLPISEQPLKLLDVGCGAGSFLAEAQPLGYDVEGQEISPYFIDYCRNQHGLKVHDGFLDDLSLPPESYDCITSFDVIEHHGAPSTFLRQIHGLLKPGGIILMSTPDIGNWFARQYGAEWQQIHAIGHIYYFDRDTITALLEKSGFRLRQLGGMHTIDHSTLAMAKNRVTQFARVVLLRAALIGLYKPLTARIPALTKWEIKLGEATLNHKKLLVRVGDQILMDDTMIFVAQKV